MRAYGTDVLEVMLLLPFPTGVCGPRKGAGAPLSWAAVNRKVPRGGETVFRFRTRERVKRVVLEIEPVEGQGGKEDESRTG